MAGLSFSSDFTIMELHTGHLFAPKGTPGNDVFQWCEDRAGELGYYSKQFCPPNRSRARGGITYARGNMLRNTEGWTEVEGFKRIGFGVSCDVPYAKFVHEGTASQGRRFIYTTVGWADKATVDDWIKNKQFRGSPDDKGYWMPIGRTQGRVVGPLSAQRTHGGFGFALRVYGQQANPFMSDAYRFVQAQHRSLPRLRRHKWSVLDL